MSTKDNDYIELVMAQGSREAAEAVEDRLKRGVSAKDIWDLCEEIIKYCADTTQEYINKYPEDMNNVSDNL